MSDSRIGSAVLLFGLAAAIAAGVPTPGSAQTGLPCPVDPCCAARPSYSDPLYSFTGDVVVGTREVEANTNACVTIFDITQPYPGDGQNYGSVLRYHGPGDSWNITNLGSVFGLTIDKYGNIFVCHSTAYGFDATGPGGAGAVYRIANGTGAINTFVALPNSFGVGLGNITYDCEHDQFFATNHEDGRIYRIKTASANAPTASVIETFDPMGPDDGTTGFAPLGERLWGVQWHLNRVYYGVWSQNCNQTGGPPNSIRSVALDGSGAFLAGSDQLEITLPPHVNNYSHPVSDISFSPYGSMLLAERSMSGPSSPAAHESRLMEYACLNPGWAPSGNSYVLGVSATCCCSGIAGNGTNSSGGVDCDFETYVPGTPYGRVWGTSDAINGSLTVYGIQGLPPGGGTPANSAWLDFDGSLASSEKTSLGDVEVPCPDIATATTLSLFTADPAERGIELRWRFGDAGEVASVRLERAPAEAGPWRTVTASRNLEGDVTVVLDPEVRAGHAYYYRLEVVSISGERLSFGPVRGSLPEPVARFAISRLTPTPSPGSVLVEFAVPREAAIRVSVVDVQGRELAVLAEGTYPPGRHTVSWSGDSGATRGGLYFVRYRTPEGNLTRRLIVTP